MDTAARCSEIDISLAACMLHYTQRAGTENHPAALQEPQLSKIRGVENTCYIQAMIPEAHHGAEDLPWICNRQVGGWVLRTQRPAPSISQVKARSTTLRRKASYPLYTRPHWH